MPHVLRPEATDRLVRELDDPSSWSAAATALTAELGFRLIEPDPTGRRGAATEGHLLVALRDSPTLRHFDPELVSYYAPAPAGAAPATFARLPAGASVHTRALWGHVHVVDRVPVENRFLTFGGTLDCRAVDDALTIAHLRSPAPIVRWGGHSQGTDALTLAIGAFFGRLLVPVDFRPGAAQQIDAAPADVLFAAFLSDTVRRAAGRRRLLGDPSELDRWLAATWARTGTNPPLRAAAETLLADIGF
ncbi:MAG TPA: hypothetical protein VHL56_09045 [Candidatus Limnocylindrales bacterium]|jgi:hypothetical protein|nr:hypothetical protein [Candidatus Limnocylindrales bacterium]